MTDAPNASVPESFRTAPSRPAAGAAPAKVFAAQDGAAIRVTCALDHLIQLRTGAAAGCRLRPAVADVSGPLPTPVKLAAMDWRDAERVDLAVLDQAMAVLAAQAAATRFLVPASFPTLSAQRGRRLVMDHIEALADRLARPVALEIRDLRGVPAGRLAEVVALVKPVCKGVLGEVEPDRVDIAAVAACGLNGLTIRPRRDWTADPRQTEQFTAMGDLARRVAPNAITRAFSVDGLGLLARAHFSHATMGADLFAAAQAGGYRAAAA